MQNPQNAVEDDDLVNESENQQYQFDHTRRKRHRMRCTCILVAFTSELNTELSSYPGRHRYITPTSWILPTLQG
jgi:predicted patatin/cPLA2 family phospholipase